MENRKELAFLAGYTRKSRSLDPNTTAEELFRNHRPALERKAAEAQLVLPPERIYMEKGSGDSIVDRPIFQALMEEVDRLPIQAGGVLIVVCQDRLSRGNMLEQMSILARLQRAGVRVLSVLEGWIDLDDVDQRSFAELRSWIAARYNQEYKKKANLARQALLQRGEVRQGKVPYGYWWDKREKDRRDRMKIDDREVSRHPWTGLTPWEILGRWCVEALDSTVPELSRRYDVPETTIYSTLKTPTIAGYPVTKTQPNPEARSRGDRRRKRKKDDWIWPDDRATYPAACDLNQWLQIQEALSGRRAGSIGHGQGAGICQDVVTIEGCAGPVILATCNDRAKTPTYRQLKGSDRRSSVGARDVARTAVDDAACQAVRDLVQDPEFLGWMIREYYQARTQEEPPDRDGKLLEANRQIVQWDKEREKVRRWAREAETEEEENSWRNQGRELDKLIKAKGEERDQIRKSRSPIPAVDAAVPVLLTLARECDPRFWATHWDKVWGGLTPPTRRLLVRAWIKEIPVRYEQRCYRGPTRRVLLPVVYTEFVEAARINYAKSGYQTTSPVDVGEIWAQIGQLLLAAQQEIVPRCANILA